MNIFKKVCLFFIEWNKLNNLTFWFVTLPEEVQHEIYFKYSNDTTQEELMARKYQK